MIERRGLILSVVAAALVAAGVADRIDRGRPTTAVVAAAGPSARALDGGASTWYCPLANAQPANNLPADGSVVVQNTRPTATDGVMTLYPTTGAPVTVPIRVGPRSRLVAHESDFIKTPAVGAVVEMERGGTAVEQSVTSSLGESTSPCATAAGDSWYLAEGSTALNNSMFLGLFNPFPDDAIVDLDFATEQGRTAPGAFQGIVVPAQSVLSVNVGDHVRRREHVAVAATARRGRIVVGRVQLRSQPRAGLTVSLAAPAAQRFWDFPDGIVGDSVGERFHIYNPSKREASVELALTLDQGAAEPFELKVGPGERLTVDPGTESRVPKGVGHAATITSDVGVVAERTLDYIPPAPRQGQSITLGATAAARHWLLPDGGLTEVLEEWVVVHNTGRRAAEVSVTAITGGHRVALDGLASVEVPAGQRRTFRLLDSVAPRPDLPLAIDATQPVVVERVLARVGKTGVSQSIAIPVEE
ncbi:MAG TPA: DUF5719 family protein [Acidimicrobiales bacterium]|nr:DUF5719 family protein [Acidimicrobiales bacterium]